ncbi:phage portal protein [Streptomyces sp. ISL-12]|uniref:phage portal protein n=1 Tax=Streptomyces sp. ISL-12 TaxID=2819177 RepID=UPI001BE7EF73|nr:phage portal protein [Streptomyces sp. ISL-12]MBT2412628.1 phage portal protein [Streptomyces sp. ISL-12]
MPVDASTVESPGWWLQRLGKKLLEEREDTVDTDGERTPGLDTLRDYAEGRPPIPHVLGVDPREAREWMKDARTNWTALVLDSPSERMHVDGFRFGDPDDDSEDARKADTEANRIWQENSLDADADLVHYGALSQRRAFTLVERGDDGRPVITHETPRQVAVEHVQGSRRKLAAGLKLWRDDWTGNTRATLWTPEQIVDFISETDLVQFSGHAAELRGWDALVLPDADDGSRPNDLGMVPLVPFINRRNRRLTGFAEHEDVLSIQNRINLSLINLMAAMKYGAFRQRWAAGLEVGEDPVTGKPIEPFQLDIRRLWTTDDAEVKFGEFAATDLKPYVAAVQAAVQDLAAISRTPPHYLIGAVVNVSGDALKAAETGLISKVRDRQRSFGESWEQTMRLAFRVLGDEAKATTYTAETIWRDPESRSIAELADAAVKKSTAGVPWRQRMEDMGYTPGQISRMEIDRAADALNAQTATDPTAQQPISLDDARAARDQRPVIGREELDDDAITA